MNSEIVVALIGLLGVVISVLVSARTTQDKLMHKIETQNEVQNQKIDQLSTDIAIVKNELLDNINSNKELTNIKLENIEKEIAPMKEDLKEHNHYAKLFSETVPVIQEQMKVANKRIGDLEDDMRFFHRKEAN